MKEHGAWSSGKGPHLINRGRVRPLTSKLRPGESDAALGGSKAKGTAKGGVRESLAFDIKIHFTVVRVKSGRGQCGEKLCGPRANPEDWMTRDLGRAAQLCETLSSHWSSE